MDEPKDDAQPIYPEIYGNYLPTITIGPRTDSPTEFERELAHKGRIYQSLMERNPHPMHISIPNPAWQQWTDEHSKEQPT